MRKEKNFSGSEKGESGVSIILSSRSYFSGRYFHHAGRFLELARKIENNYKGQPTHSLELDSYVMSSILLTTAYLEASINELYQDAYDGSGSFLIKDLDKDAIAILADFWNMTEMENRTILSILDKYQMALRFTGKEPFEKGKNPYQDANLVIKIRNELTHYKPMDLNSEKKHPLDDKLINKFKPNKMMEDTDNNFFPDKAFGVGCIEWCLKSARNFTDEFYLKMNIEPPYKK